MSRIRSTHSHDETDARSLEALRSPLRVRAVQVRGRVGTGLFACLLVLASLLPSPALAIYGFGSISLYSSTATHTAPETTPETTTTARLNLGGFGATQVPGFYTIDGGGTIVEPPPPPPPPAPPPLRNPRAGFDWVAVDAVTEAGTTSQLYTAPGTSGPWTFRRNLLPDAREEIREAGLALGERVCFQVRTQDGQGESTDSLCVRADERVGFEPGEMSPEASRRIVDAFRWRDTQPVPVGDDPEQPALYAMAALVGMDVFERDIRDLGIHVQSLPLFPSEFPSWSSDQAVLTLDGGDVRVWRFVVVPGFLYNAIRERNVAREAAGLETSVLVFREIAVPAARFTPWADHRLDYEHLRDNYFAYNGRVNEDSCLLGDPKDPCPLILGSIVREIVTALVDGVEGLIEGVRRVYGYFDRHLGDEYELTVHFELQHAEPGGFQGVMRSGWSGDPLTLEGATIQVRQGFSMFTHRVNAQGFMRRLVGGSRDTSVCIVLENDAVEITEFLTEKTICLDHDYVVDEDTELTLSVRHPSVSAFAAMTDAHRFVKQVMGLEMSKVKVLTGWQGDLLTVDDLSYAPCLGALGLTVGDLIPIVGQVPELLLGGIDVVLSTRDVASRGVPVHEYGHAVMCELMRDAGRSFFEVAWTDVITGTLDKSPDNEAWVVNEAFADFISSQVLGATNYVDPFGSHEQGDMHYALAGNAGLERNFQRIANPDLEDQVGFVASILHDLFDGHGDRPEPSDGTHWSTFEWAPDAFTLVWDGGLEDSDDGDEGVALVGPALLDLLGHVADRGWTLSFDSFLGGLEQLAVAEGFSGHDVCRAFALHYPDGSCPNYSGMDVRPPLVVTPPSTGTIYDDTIGGASGTSSGGWGFELSTWGYGGWAF